MSMPATESLRADEPGCLSAVGGWVLQWETELKKLQLTLWLAFGVAVCNGNLEKVAEDMRGTVTGVERISAASHLFQRVP